ncbi:hypothetical protein RJ639_042630 [Escallonia herrerae]|uniref:Retrotransposon gag domain-containing protein n=1 Tax=Escallonia herrerae TaxID=1293975 RepID=A0AA89BA28_9ASTE|nr:hypothetical protein RJ639_042630 [Escallonia herrerae]
MASEPGYPEERLNCLEAQMDKKLKDLMEKILKMISGINTGLDSVSNEKEHGEASHNRRQRSDANNGGGGGSSGTYLHKMVKLDFRKFNRNEDPTSWVCRADQFFDFHQTPNEEKLPLASFNLEGDAQVWYQLIKEDQGTISWPTFKEELHVGYGPTQFQDFFGNLTKLQQFGTVKEYQTQFERLLIRAGKLSQEQQVGCFISGLKENLKVDVQACRRTSLSSAIGLARLYEARNRNTRRNTVMETKKVVSSPSGPNRSNMLVKRLSPTELSERRAKGSWSDEEDKETINGDSDAENEQKGETPEISIHAISGLRNPQTMRIQGKIDNKHVSFLIDSGSTHNFLSTRIAKKMGLVPSCEGDLEVIVANGEKLASSGRCKGV